MLPCSLLRRAPKTARCCPLGGVFAQQQQQVRLPSAVECSSISTTSRQHAVDAEDKLSPEYVLSKESREACLRRLSRMSSLKPPSTPSPGTAGPKQAAILVPLCVVDGELCLLYTLRSPHISSHRGQVSFPGGMKDDEDDSFETTALRETEEELGVLRERVDIWGRCPAAESANRVNAVPVIGFLGEVRVDQVNFNPKEVGEVFTMSLRHLCDKRNFRYTQFRTGKGYAIPVFLGGKYKVWGLTAAVTHIFLSALLPSVYKNKVNYVKPLQV